MSKMRKSLRRAFTLPEVLLAAAILSFTIATFFICMVACLYLNDSNRNLTLAAEHAQYVLEEIKDTSFINIAAKINNGDWNWNAGQVNTKGLDALRNETISTAVSGTDMLTVTVTVSWLDRSRRARTIQAGSMFTEL